MTGTHRLLAVPALVGAVLVSTPSALRAQGGAWPGGLFDNMWAAEDDLPGRLEAPMWAKDGKSLVFSNGGTIETVTPTGQPYVKTAPVSTG